MEFDYSKLLGKIREVFGTQTAFATAIGISYQSMSDKLNNQSEFTSSEIFKSVKALKIPIRKIPLYFFTLKVQ